MISMVFRIHIYILYIIYLQSWSPSEGQSGEGQGEWLRTMQPMREVRISSDVCHLRLRLLEGAKFSSARVREIDHMMPGGLRSVGGCKLVRLVILQSQVKLEPRHGVTSRLHLLGGMGRRLCDEHRGGALAGRRPLIVRWVNCVVVALRVTRTDRDHVLKPITIILEGIQNVLAIRMHKIRPRLP